MLQAETPPAMSGTIAWHEKVKEVLTVIEAWGALQVAGKPPVMVLMDEGHSSGRRPVQGRR